MYILYLYIQARNDSCTVLQKCVTILGHW